jgi:DNA-directed RNA polymerase specialized sigma24 family protein
LALAEQWSTASADDLPPLPTCRTAKQLSPDELKALVTAYKAGSTVYELAAQFGIHRATVGQRLRAQGVDTTPLALLPEDVRVAIKLYRAGQSTASIAERFHVSADTVRSQLIKAGVVMRRPWERGVAS